MARHGICDTMVSDNGPQYRSEEFRRFSKDWDFTHVTSSLHYPSSNHLAETAVKTVKKLIMKCIDTHEDIYKALLAYRSTPLTCGKSPAQLLMGRRLKGTLLVSSQLLKTDHDSAIVDGKLQDKLKKKQ